MLVEHKICEGLDDLKKRLTEVQGLGGEGSVYLSLPLCTVNITDFDTRRLMLRQPGSLYVSKRSKTLLKVKTFYDAEAKVIGYEPGKVNRTQLPALETKLRWLVRGNRVNMQE